MPFRDVIGHRKLVALLARSIERDSLPPSLIFAGPSGIGKHLVAVATAQAVNCLNPTRTPGNTVERDACGSCSACTRIARGLHPDVPRIEPGDTGSIKVDVVRDIVEAAGYRPFEGRRRVVIINDADALVDQAQNALLKTLEEPPAGSMFLLITARPDALLPTVRSRCPQLRFQPLAAAEVAAALVKSGRTQQEASAVAANAEGSIGRAFAASAEDLINARAVGLRVLTQLASAGDGRRRLESTKDLLDKTGGGRTGAEDREQVALHLRAMASLLRDIEVLATRADRRVISNPEAEATLGRLTAFHGDRALRAFQTVDRALVALESNAGVKIVADWVALNV